MRTMRPVRRAMHRPVTWGGGLPLTHTLVIVGIVALIAWQMGVRIAVPVAGVLYLAALRLHTDPRALRILWTLISRGYRSDYDPGRRDQITTVRVR